MGRGPAPVITGKEKGGRGLGEILEGSTDEPPALPDSDLKSGQTSGSLGCQGTIGPFQNENSNRMIKTKYVSQYFQQVFCFYAFM